MEDLVIKGLTKVDEFSDPELLDQSALTQLDNMTLDLTGAKAVKRGGFGLFNSNASGGAVYSIHDVVDSGANNYLLAQVNGTLKKSALGTGTWSNLKTGLNATAKTYIVPYNSKYIITNGQDTPFITDITSTWNLSIAAPVITGIVSNGANYGNMTPNAKYLYYMVYKTALGERSQVSQPFTHYCNANDSNTTSSTVTTVEFSVLPNGASADSRVVSKQIFRTQANGSVPYLLATLEAEDALFIDSNPDTALDLSETIEILDPPIKAAYIITHKERIVVANITQATYVNQPTHSKVGNGYTFSAVEGTVVSGLPAGTYKYRVYWFDEFGSVSGYQESNNVTLTGLKSINVRHIPRPSGLQVGVSARLYRTSDAGVTWYSFGSIGDGDGIFDDYTNAELTVVTLPTETSSSIVSKSRILYSEIAKPNEFPQFNSIEVYPDDADEITGLVDDTDGIIIFKKNSICKLYTNGSPVNWRVERLISQIGCDQPESIQKIGEKIYFMNNFQVYRYPDYISIPLSNTRRTTFSAISSIKSSAYSNYYQWYVLVTNNSVLVYDEKIETWYKFTANSQSWESVIEKKFGSYRGGLLFGHSSLQVISKYVVADKLDYDGSTTYQITPTLKTKTYIFNEPTALARPRLFHSNYYKRDGQSVVHTFTSVDENITHTYTDTDNANGMILTAVLAVAGSGYLVGETLTISGGTGGTVTVDSVGSSGEIGSITLATAGYGYTAGTKATAGGSGTSATITITINPTYYKTIRKPIETITKANKLNYQISGAGLDEFNSTKIQYNVINRGRRA